MSLAVVGEALVDILLPPDGSRTERPGGSCLNVAVAAARLGVSTALITQLGDDERGELVRRHATGSGVTLEVVPTSNGRTSTAAASLDDSGVADYTFDLDWSMSVDDLPATVAPQALHMGSLGTWLAPGREAVAELVRRVSTDGSLVSYDPNVRSSFIEDREAALADVRAWAGLADLVKLSDEDAGHLAPGSDPGELAASLLGPRTRLVVLTRGGDGATAYAEDLTVSVPSPASEVADTVGAGDTFTAGLVAALLMEDRLRDDAWHREELIVRRVLASAAAAAAVTVTRPGADPPTLGELAEWPRG